MYTNNSLTIPLQTIQNDLSQLENSLLKLKLVISQNSLQIPSSSDVDFKISSQFEAIQRSITNFCSRYQQELKNTQNRLEVIAQISGFSERKQWGEDQKYLIVTEKISNLQRSLKKTQQNQQKLIETINTLMMKYQIQDQPTLIQNDEYLRSRIKTSQSSSLITFQPCSAGTRLTSYDQQTSLRENLKKTMKRSEANIYLVNSSNQSGLPARNSQSPQYLRNFTKQGPGIKISLKQTSGAAHQTKNLNPSRPFNQSPNFHRSASSDKHDHRFKFMMNNLYY